MTFGDRTSEFAAVAQQLRQKDAVVVRPRVKESKAAQKISVNRAASEISHDTYEVAQKLKELMKCTPSCRSDCFFVRLSVSRSFCRARSYILDAL
jgi:hypothetical protein